MLGRIPVSSSNSGNSSLGRTLAAIIWNGKNKKVDLKWIYGFMDILPLRNPLSVTFKSVWMCLMNKDLFYLPFLQVSYLSESFTLRCVFFYFEDAGFNGAVGVPHRFVSDSRVQVPPPVGVQVLPCVLIYILATRAEVLVKQLPAQWGFYCFTKSTTVTSNSVSIIYRFKFQCFTMKNSNIHDPINPKCLVLDKSPTLNRSMY